MRLLGLTSAVTQSMLLIVVTDVVMVVPLVMISKHVLFGNPTLERDFRRKLVFSFQNNLWEHSYFKTNLFTSLIHHTYSF